MIKGIVELTINDAPAVRAFAIAYEMVKYRDDNKTQMAFLEELQKISPVKRKKRTGYFNDETLEYYNAIMENFNKNGILKNPIFIDRNKSKAATKTRR